VGDLVGIATGAGGVTMLVTVLVNLYKIWSDGRKQDAIITRQLSDQHIKALDALQKRESEHPWGIILGSLGRFLMTGTALGVLVALSFYGMEHPEVTMFIPEQDTYSLRFLGMKIFELDLGTTWASFNGVVVLPVWFSIIGAAVGHFFGQAPFRR